MCVRNAQVSGQAVVVLGDRKGSLSVVELPGGGGGEGGGAGGGAGEVRPGMTLQHAHKKNSVTSLTAHPDGLLYSSGRDGTVNAWRLGREGTAEGGGGAGGVVGAETRGGFRLVREGSVQGWGGLELISGVAWQRGTGKLLVMGFQHMHFVVWDEPRRARLWRVDCGSNRAFIVHFFRV
jgi:hypothetical protein